MPINIESTLQGIRQGGTLPQNTLAGQVGAMQQARKNQQAAILQAMQEAQLARQKEQRLGVKLAHDVQQDQREAALKNRLNTLTTLEQLARQDPAQAGRLLTSSEGGRRLAFKLGVDPQNPDPDKIKAYRDGLFAEVAEKLPEIPKENERALPAPTGSALHRALGLDADVGQEIKYVDEAPYVNEDGEVVNIGNITNFEDLGVSKEKREEIGGSERAGGDLTRGDVVYSDFGDIPIPEGLSMAAGPIDRMVAAGTRIPGLSQAMEYIAKEENFGKEQRIALRISDELENRVIMAFKPSDDDRTSNLQIELGRKLSPRIGLLSTDESVQTDLEVLHERTEAKLNKQIGIANNEKFPDSTRKQAAERAIELGSLLELTSPLLQASKDPAFVVENLMGKSTESATPDEIAQTLSRVSERQRKEFFEALPDSEKKRLKEAWSQ